VSGAGSERCCSGLSVAALSVESSGGRRIEAGAVERAGAAGAAAPAERSPAYVYADVPNRLIGILIDGALLSLVIFLGAVALSALFGPVVRIDLDSYSVSVDQGLAVANAVVNVVVGGVYFVGSYTLLRASPGHRVLAMELRDATGLNRVTLGSALVRWLLLAAPLGIAAVLTTLVTGSAQLLADLAVLGWYLVLLVTTARSPAKQGLHDRLARTIMVKAARPIAAQAPRSEA
jgi:hypothetical protein